MTEQEYKNEVDRIVDAAFKEADKYEYKPGYQTTAEEMKQDNIPDLALELMNDHPWLKDLTQCFCILLYSPHRDEYFKDAYDRNAKNLVEGLREMADAAFSMDVLEHKRFNAQNN